MNNQRIIMPYNKTLEEGLKEFDEEFPRENDGSISRFCRLDYPDGDDRSIRNFITGLAEKIRESVVEEVIEKIDKLESEITQDGWEECLAILRSILKNK